MLLSRMDSDDDRLLARMVISQESSIEHQVALFGIWPSASEEGDKGDDDDGVDAPCPGPCPSLHPFPFPFPSPSLLLALSRQRALSNQLVP